MQLFNSVSKCGRTIAAISYAIAVATSCTPAKTAPRSPSVSESKAPAPGQDATASTSPTPSVNANSAKIDIVLAVAISSSSSDRAAALTKELATVLAEIGVSLKSKDARIALLGSPTGNVSGIATQASDLGLKSDLVRQINFELDSKDSFLGITIADCEGSTSNLDSSHAPGSVKVCGQSVKIPPHSWTWTVDDLKGKLLGFLRPGAKRIYLLVTDGDPAVMSSSEFISFASTQNNNIKPIVHAIAPMSSGPNCTSTIKNATLTAGLVNATGGSTIDFCAAGWKNSLSKVIGSFN